MLTPWEFSDPSSAPMEEVGAQEVSAVEEVAGRLGRSGYQGSEGG